MRTLQLCVPDDEVKDDLVGLVPPVGVKVDIHVLELDLGGQTQ